MDGACLVSTTRSRWRPPGWLLVLAAACSIHYGRERLLDGGLLLEELEALPDPALHLLERLNLTEKLVGVKQVLEERKHQATPPGAVLKRKIRAKHPMIMIPGIISCGLEVWQATECLGDSHFRERVWGGVSMAQMVLRNLTCWLEHLALDPRTGLDPPGKEVRAAEGFSAADYFAPSYWLWAKLIESAAHIGYHPGNSAMACYDWRLPFMALEQRDRYFTRLRQTIETLVESAGHKAVIIGHSMGASVFLVFCQWVSRVAGEEWVSTHIHAFVSLAGALLGAVGPLGALLSGEMQTTAILGPLNKLLDSQTSPLNITQIRNFFRSLGGLGGLLPKGGGAVWGSAESPTDTAADLVTLDGVPVGPEALLTYMAREMGSNTVMAGYSHGTRLPEPLPESHEVADSPLSSALPLAPDMRIFCLYGVGIETERAYWYTSRTEAHGPARPGHFGMIDYNHHSSAGSGKASLNRSDAAYSSGVATTDGDGTVPLLSLGYMCAGAWRAEGLRAFNPSQSPVHIREYPDQPSHMWEDPRGGPGTSKHVEILGNRELTTDLLHILSGQDEHLRAEDRIHSEIRGIADRVTNNLLRELRTATSP